MSDYKPTTEDAAFYEKLRQAFDIQEIEEHIALREPGYLVWDPSREELAEAAFLYREWLIDYECEFGSENVHRILLDLGLVR